MTAAAPAVGCPFCANALPPDTWNLDYETYCPTCRAPILALVFPALFRPVAGTAAELAVEGGEATCFFHVRKKAVAPCDQCGRFLCSLCMVELSGQTWCPTCLQSRRKEGQLPTLDNHRMMYDNLALLLALGPVVTVVFWFLSILTAPAALFVVVRYWRTPLSVAPRTKARFIVAGAVALLELVAWGLLIMGASVGFLRRFS